MRLTYKDSTVPHTNAKGELWKAYSDHDYNDVINKLADYEDAEEQGLLVRLPYKVGDSFWAIAYLEPRVIHVRLYQITVHYEHGYILWVENIDNDTDWWKLSMREFDKWSHFNFREEAEDALKRMKGERENGT